MIHESNKVNDIAIVESDINFNVIYKKSYFPKDFEETLKKANLLLIPYEGFRDYEDPVFPEQTMEFYNFIKKFESEELIGDICISDEDYTELELHNDLITLSDTLVTAAVLPIAVNLISNYLDRKIKERSTMSELKVKVNITVVEGENSKTISYEGDANKFEETLKVLKKFNI